uniref:RecQ-mediated genome instability protein 1 n=1 Tax=Meloidogyne enterolobii TaxID=390850 RepID=A0A6V7TS71_MELEN|nr:unnamed protein product [Meloidogyne enterolobii]
MTQLEEIHLHFASNHIKLKMEWLREVVNFLSNIKSSTDKLIGLVYQQWIYSNIKHSTEPIKEFENFNDIFDLPQPLLLQIESVTDIGTSFLKQYQTLVQKDYDESAAEIGVIELDDYKIDAFEQKRIPNLLLSTPPGSKILLFRGTRINQNIIFLDPKKCQLLGGAVYDLMLQNNSLHSLCRLLNIQIPSEPRSAQMTQLEEIHLHFASNHIKLKMEWLREVVNFLSNIKSSTDKLIGLVYQQWIYSNIKQSTEPIKEFENFNDIFDLPQPLLLQIESVTDIGTSFLKQYQTLVQKDYDESAAEIGVIELDDYKIDKKFKCFSLQLTDGERIFKAFEQKRIPNLLLSTPPGSKILLFRGTRINQNIIFLDPKKCQLLGGAVYDLMLQNNSLHSLCRLLNIQIPSEPRSAQMTQLEEIHLHFASNHIKLKMEWLREVVNFLSNIKSSTDKLIGLVYQQWIYSNIKQSTEPIKEFENFNDIFDLPQPLLLQIESVTDIALLFLNNTKHLYKKTTMSPLLK